jgi:hypothetical protein
MTFLSTHHSPNTVNRKAKVFTIGTIKLNSVIEPALAKSVYQLLMVKKVHGIRPQILSPTPVFPSFKPLRLRHSQPSSTRKALSLLLPSTLSNHSQIASSKTQKKRSGNSPAFPINKKNQILPVRLITNGNAYLQFFSKSVTLKNVL